MSLVLKFQLEILMMFFGEFINNDDFMNLYNYKEYTFLGFEIYPDFMYDKNTYTYINENEEYSILDLKYDFEDQIRNTVFLDQFSKPVLDKIISIINEQIIDGYEITHFEIGFTFTKKKAELTLTFVGGHYGPDGKYFLGKKAAKEDSFVINSITKKELEKIGYDFNLLSTVNDKKLDGNAFLYSAYIFHLIGNGEEYENSYFKYYLKYYLQSKILVN